MIGLPTKGRGRERSLLEALQERRARIVHLTHNDLDAVGADAVHRMVHGDVFSIFSSVSAFCSILEQISQVEGRGDLLSITDLGYRREIEEPLAAAAGNGWKIEWRDHHRWEPEAIERVRRMVTLLHLDPSTCACGIVARDMGGEDPRIREIARVVCDYDLWRNQDPRAGVLARVLSRNENREHVRDALMRGEFSNPVIESQYAEIRREMEECIGRSRQYTRIHGNRYRIAIAPLFGYPSETAAAIRDSTGSEIEVLVSHTGRFSIRSVPPISHLIAREFDGGGHPHAAGGSFDFSLLDRIVFLLLKRTSHEKRLVEKAELIGSRTT